MAASQQASLQQHQQRSFLPRGLKPGDYHLLEDGKKNVRPWAEGVPAWLKLANWEMADGNSHYACILYLASRMVPNRTAVQWWRSRTQLAGSDHGGFYTYVEFLEQLVGACGEQNAVVKARDGILALRQTGSVSEYANRFGALAAELPAGEGQGWLAHLFQKGLKAGLRAIILGKFAEGSTWLQIRDMAVQHDSVAQEATSAAAFRSGPEPMELGYTSASDSERSHGRGSYGRGRSKERARGHGRSATPHPGRRGGEEDNQESQPGACFRCGQVDHWKRDCKGKPKTK
jgi:hypothetical protein